MTLHAIALEHDAINSTAAIEAARLLRRLDNARTCASNVRMKARLSVLLADHNGDPEALREAIAGELADAEQHLDALSAAVARLSDTDVRLRTQLHPARLALEAERGLLTRQHQARLAEVEQRQAAHRHAVATLTEAGMTEAQAVSAARPSLADIAAVESSMVPIVERLAAIEATLCSCSALAATIRPDPEVEAVEAMELAA